MKRKDLLSLPAMGVTDEIRKLANADTGVEDLEKYGYREEIVKRYERFGYLRAGVREKILMIEMYIGDTLRTGSEEPRFIVFLSGKENTYTTYDTRDRKWRSAKIKNLEDGRYQYGKHFDTGYWIEEKEKELVLKYLKSEEGDAREAINSWQGRAMHRKEIREIDRVMDQVTCSPADFGRWVQEEAFWERQYLFYDGKRGKAYCTACGKTMAVRMRSVHNQTVACPNCGREVTAKSWNKQKQIGDSVEAALLQKIPDGYILRMFSCRKHLEKDNLKGEWKEAVNIWEESRKLLNDSMTVQREYDYAEFKQTGHIRWCRSNYIGYYDTGILYPGNIKELRAGIPKLCDIEIEKILEIYKGRNIRLEAVLNSTPLQGYLIRAGLTRLAWESYGSGCPVNKKGKTEGEVLKINKNRTGRLKKLNGGKEILLWLRWEEKTGKKLRDELLKRLERAKITPEDLKRVMECGATPEKALNYIEKQEGNSREALREWGDYLDMAEQERMNVRDDIVRYPKNLKRRHNQLVEIRNEKWDAERIRKGKKKYGELDKKIRSRLPEAARYYWQDENYMIVPAAACEELMKEGRALHHCVGAGDAYMARMAKGYSWILFLRKKERPEVPYYTIEIEIKDDKILQWYSEYDRKPDRERIEKVLQKFKKSLKSARVQIMATA